MGFPLVRMYGFVALALVWRYRASTAAYSGFLASGGYGVIATAHRGSQGRTAALGFFSKLWGWLQGFLWSGAWGIIFWEKCLLILIFCWI